VNGETNRPVNRYPITEGKPSLLAANPIVAAAVKTTPIFSTSGAVSTMEAMSHSRRFETSEEMKIAPVETGAIS
jgi:hypothetical protein